ncbi:hypothetical protein BZA05DRAFT_119554 [Tricharina praecox]|uniref:uncharacterized protein n=1 Tax=Tricharina praecox TaxID=43433 RepID=UPI0022204E33|nr:uncharacterized protein BZA05DRAFT_119554 [Tricharina praecox]KAI5848080.1 hypothetical protein BZA05DRAFT_119554 [Tricharina praecox]
MRARLYSTVPNTIIHVRPIESSTCPVWVLYPLSRGQKETQSVNPSIRQSVNPSIRQSVNPSIRQSVNPSIRQSRRALPYSVSMLGVHAPCSIEGKAVWKRKAVRKRGRRRTQGRTDRLILNCRLHSRVHSTEHSTPLHSTPIESTLSSAAETPSVRDINTPRRTIYGCGYG